MSYGTLHSGSWIKKIVKEEMYSWWMYLLEHWIRIFYQGPDGGVKVGAVGAGSLILIPPADLPMVFLACFCGVRLAIFFFLPAWVFKALALVEGSLVDSSLGGQAKTRMVGIGMSPSKPGMGEMKLSNACIQIKEI
jgi:hypothetical protein